MKETESQERRRKDNMVKPRERERDKRETASSVNHHNMKKGAMEAEECSKTCLTFSTRHLKVLRMNTFLLFECSEERRSEEKNGSIRGKMGFVEH